jgi:PTS system nitrogen regulatory IIA component
MNLDTLISSNAVITNQKIKSKKRALEVLAEHLATEATLINQQSDNTDTPDAEISEAIDPLEIFHLLTNREKLGSTGMGHGVALPHARTSLTQHAVGAFLKLDKGIDFDSPDQQPTDLIFSLMVPEHYTDEHLKILAYLAGLFSDEAFCDALRKTNSAEDIHRQLTTWQLAS